MSPAVFIVSGIIVLANIVVLGNRGPSSATAAERDPNTSRSCPLSEEQTRKSIEAFSKLASFMTHEPRCVNCHGGVNPHIDGIGRDPEDPDAPASIVEHGVGAQPREDFKGERIIPIGCRDCHNNMARKTDGSESRWMTAPNVLAFVGKNATTLCRQIKRRSDNARDFIGHLKDDNGGNNFSVTAFNGDRGLDRQSLRDYGVPIQKPSISHQALLKLGQDWVDAMGGELKGDEACGCVAAGWILSYQVQIRGQGNQPRARRDSQISWKVDRSYSGSFELTRSTPLPKNLSALANITPQQLMSMTPQQLRDLQQQMTTPAGGLWMPTGPTAPTDLAVDDSIVSFEPGPGEGDSFEDTTTTQTYKGTGHDDVREAVFQVDPASNTYNVTIGIGPTGQKAFFVMQESVEVNRSQFGFGGAPTHEAHSVPPRREPFRRLEIPTVKGLLDKGIVHHAMDRPLNFVDGMLQFDSGWIAAKPLTPPFSSWPQADRNLKIRVYYKISRLQ
jgi:hypothetical protein